MNPLLAETYHIASGGSATGGGLLNTVWTVLVFGLCFAIIYALGVWCIGAFSALSSKPAIRKLWDGLFIFIGAIVLINFLLSLVGHGFIAW